MEILRKDILPLFEITRKRDIICQSNKLINNEINKYLLYVDLKDIYLNKCQTHQIKIHDKILEYTIPLHYHEIIIQGKGYQHEDIIINIYSKRDENYIRVNSNDLLYVKKLTVDEWKKGIYVFKHLDDEEIIINLKAPKIQKIDNKGLPMADNKRGCLYVWIDVNICNDDIKDNDMKEDVEDKENENEQEDVEDKENEQEDKKEDKENERDEEERRKCRMEIEYKRREEKEKEFLLEILNYHANSNVIFIEHKELNSLT